MATSVIMSFLPIILALRAGADGPHVWNESGQRLKQRLGKTERSAELEGSFVPRRLSRHTLFYRPCGGADPAGKPLGRREGCKQEG